METKQPGQKQERIWVRTKYVYRTSGNDLKALNTEGPVTFPVSEIASCTISNIVETLPDGWERYGLLVDGILEVLVTKKRMDAFMAKLAKGEVVRMADPDTLIAATLSESLPNCIAMVDRVFGLARWRFNLSGDENKILSKKYEWSEDGNTWHSLNFLDAPVGTVRMMIAVELTADQIREEMVKLLQEGASEPIYHAMIREAEGQQFSSPKSAFITAVSAVEVAVKHYISRKVPDADWLIETMPSPDIHKILKEYVPRLDNRFLLTAMQLEEIRKIIGNRNTLVHTGKISFDFQRTVNSIVFLSDVIHLIDFYSGRNWTNYYS
ncbi:hypothetical protein [Chitinophaga defluvii]|uniref:Apea-like HEPN domain-containing protein n=1 Tax=Chitinophaga defluvii TaxID=3163343 RepID=A0ABV2T485_9BACT